MHAPAEAFFTEPGNPGPLCRLPLREAKALEGICPGCECGHVCLESRVRGSMGAGTQAGLSLNTQHKQTTKPLPVCGQSPARHAPPLLLLRWTSGASGAGGVRDSPLMTASAIQFHKLLRYANVNINHNSRSNKNSAVTYSGLLMCPLLF